MSPAYVPELVEDRFWAKVRKPDDADGCWPWIGSVSSGGAGSFRTQNRGVTAVRQAWLLSHGPIPDGHRVRRSCTTPACVRPSHLFLSAKAGPNARPIEQRFWAKVDKNGPVPPHCPELGPCWLWTAYRDKHGYGRMPGRLAHHVSLSIHLRAPLAGQHVMHLCDNPPCVNPSHLKAGTRADNMADRDAKGRQAKHEKQGHAKLTLEIANEIRRLHREEGVKQVELARRFGVSGAVINGIVHDSAWRTGSELPVPNTRPESAKLTADDVREIRQLALSHPKAAIAARYGVSLQNVYLIVKRKTWREV